MHEKRALGTCHSSRAGRLRRSPPKPEQQHGGSSRSTTDTRCQYTGALGAGDTGTLPRPKLITQAAGLHGHRRQLWGPRYRSCTAPLAHSLQIALCEVTRFHQTCVNPVATRRQEPGRETGVVRQAGRPRQGQSSFLPFQPCLSYASIAGSRNKLKTKNSRSHTCGTWQGLPAVGAGCNTTACRYRETKTQIKTTHH